MSKDSPPPASLGESGALAEAAQGRSIDIFGTLAEQAGPYRVLEGLHEADGALVIASLFRQSPGPYLWLCLNNREVERVAENLCFFLPEESKDQVLVIPGSEADPYRGLSPHPEIAEKRALGLWKVLKGYRGVVITTTASIATRLPSPNNFKSNCMPLEVGSFVPIAHLLQRLRESGYLREDPVTEMGEFSTRGGIVDVYSPAHENPVRIEFFGDQVESIRSFDPATQRSIELIPSCEIVPVQEMVLTEREIRQWHEKAPEYWNEVRFAEMLQEKFQFTGNGELFNGFEYVFPIVVDCSHHLLEYFSQPDGLKIVVSHSQEFLDHFGRLHEQLSQNYTDRQAAGELVLPPLKLFFDRDWMNEFLHHRDVFYLESIPEEPESARRFDFHVERKYHGRIPDILNDVARWCEAGERTIFVMGSRGMAERLVEIFRDYGVGVHLSSGIDEALRHTISVTQGRISEGFHSPSLALHVLTQETIFEEKHVKESPRKPRREAASAFFRDLQDLKEGDYVVHVEHGIGVYRGLQRIGLGEERREFVVLTYRDDAKLYVPVDRLDPIQKYRGSGGGAPPQIDRLGGTSWERTKRRIKKSMVHLAEDLLKLYAQREMAKGYAFQPDDSLVHEFEEAFEYEETPDQHAAIQDLKRDLESEQPMDRLICGDVGYGKTEVAMRAAFKAVNDSKQVAVLAPTTVLAFQHLHTFRERFQGFPVRIEMVSRFQNRRDQADILRRCALGRVDILIGTHRLLSKDVKFQDLGLIVIDEEQRFGVAQKERLKRLKTEVDVLAMSATPIPRTLNMSLIGLRDLSIIETPPKDRLAIQTVVVKFSRNIIRSAIDLEIKREGQAFFVHNSIDTIYSITRTIQETIPEARVAVAHGQMSERQLEEVMVGFLDYRYDVLVSTTIIENGLDIPRANTLIVNQAHRFGLGELYQLRGRVGRSNRRAYAYLLIPSEDTLSQDARRRLAAIKEFSDLGAGFRIAALDLEIRGAGNLLGAEQHGHINAVGFELYMKLLEQTIRELKGEEVEERVPSSIDLRLNIQVPEHYIDDSNLRLWLYKRVSSAADEAGLEGLIEETTDRFGRYPDPVSNLFAYARLRLRAQELKILSIERKGSKVLLKFREDTPVSRSHVIELVHRNGKLSLSPEGNLVAEISSTRPPTLFEEIHALLDNIGVLE